MSSSGADIYTLPILKSGYSHFLFSRRDILLQSGILLQLFQKQIHSLLMKMPERMDSDRLKSQLLICWGFEMIILLQSSTFSGKNPSQFLLCDYLVIESEVLSLLKGATQLPSWQSSTVPCGTLKGRQMVLFVSHLQKYMAHEFEGSMPLEIRCFLRWVFHNTTRKQVKTDRTKPTAAYKTDRRSRGRF